MRSRFVVAHVLIKCWLVNAILHDSINKLMCCARFNNKHRNRQPTVDTTAGRIVDGLRMRLISPHNRSLDFMKVLLVVAPGRGEEDHFCPESEAGAHDALRDLTENKTLLNELDQFVCFRPLLFSCTPHGKQEWTV